MKYSLRTFLVDVEVAEDNGIIETEICGIPYSKGERILTDMNGRVQVMSESVFKKHYVPVEEVVVKEDSASSYETAYKEFSLDSQVEEQEYITDFQRKVRERNAQIETN